MERLKTIFEAKNIKKGLYSKYDLVKDFYQGVFTDPIDQDHGLDAVVAFSIWKLLAGKGEAEAANALVETYKEAYEKVYLPAFLYFADYLAEIATLNRMSGNIVFPLRDAEKLHDVMLKRYPSETKIGSQIKKAFLPRSITAGDYPTEQKEWYSGKTLNLSVKYQKEILGEASIIADTGLYGIQALSYFTGQDSFHFKTSGAYWGGGDNMKNIPTDLLEGLLRGKKMLPVFLVSGTHYADGFQLPGALNKLVYDHKAEITDYAAAKGIKFANETGKENLVRFLLSLFLDSTERLFPKSKISKVGLTEEGEIITTDNQSEVSKAISKGMVLVQDSFPFFKSGKGEVVREAVEGLKSFIDLSLKALDTGQFTGVLPIGVPGKYAGNENTVIDTVPTGGADSFKTAFRGLAEGNSFKYLFSNPIGNMVLPPAEAKVAGELFCNILMP